MNKPVDGTATLLGADYLELMSELVASTAQEPRLQEDGTRPYLHWPYIGSGYFQARRRVLFVGRAAREGTDDALLPENVLDSKLVLSLLHRCMRDRESTGGTPCCTEWFFTTQPAGLSIRRRSYFWKLLQSASNTLEITSHSGVDAFTCFAWSNLFKLAPRGAGNPPKWMQDLELAHGRAQRLLQLEINALDPDVVVFVTGHTWMHWFWCEGSPNRLDVNWQPDAENWREQPIHRVGYQNRKLGPPRLHVATARPELRTRNVTLARQVAPALEERLQRWTAEHPLRSS